MSDEESIDIENVQVLSTGAWSSSAVDMITSKAMQRQLEALKELAQRYPVRGKRR